MAKNVFGEDLITCSKEPLTGFYRDGCCETGPQDFGTHTVCARVTDEFLEFTKQKGNDLSTPMPEYDFPGLKEGDYWCLCVNRWLEARSAGCEPRLKLEACHEKMLDFISLDELVKYAVKS